MLKEVEKLGAACYMVSRATKLVGTNWVDKTPVPSKIGFYWLSQPRMS